MWWYGSTRQHPEATEAMQGMVTSERERATAGRQNRSDQLQSCPFPFRSISNSQVNSTFLVHFCVSAYRVWRATVAYQLQQGSNLHLAGWSCKRLMRRRIDLGDTILAISPSPTVCLRLHKAFKNSEYSFHSSATPENRTISWLEYFFLNRIPNAARNCSMGFEYMQRLAWIEPVSSPKT